jgi:hypothetical protein
MTRMSLGASCLLLFGALPAAPRGAAPLQESLPVPTATGQSLSDTQLLQLLEAMGFTPRKLSKGYLIVIQREGWTYNMQLVLSPDQTKLGINANLATSANPAALPASVWRSLLEDNEDVDPSCFYFDRKLNRLYLHRVLDNHAITPAFLRQQIDNFCQNIKSTEADWSAVK